MKLRIIWLRERVNVVQIKELVYCPTQKYGQFTMNAPLYEALTNGPDKHGLFTLDLGRYGRHHFTVEEL